MATGRSACVLPKTRLVPLPPCSAGRRWPGQPASGRRFFAKAPTPVTSTSPATVSSTLSHRSSHGCTWAPNETLTAHEVLEGLRLNCDLVTLSACESGLSRVRRGDELMGLVRAFMVAGAPAVIATLWRVDERSTRILMERFYREVAAGAGFAHALREAQLYLRSLSQSEVLSLLAGDAPAHGTGEAGADRPFADPFYWAPFILIGAGSLIKESLAAAEG